MQTKILIAIVAILALLNVYQYVDEIKGEPVLVSDLQLECLKNWRPPLHVVDVYGPEPLKGMKLAFLDTEKYSGGFELEFSSCFFDAHSEKIHVKKIPEIYNFFKSTGGKDIYFYKRSHDDYVVVYANKDG